MILKRCCVAGSKLTPFQFTVHNGDDTEHIWEVGIFFLFLGSVDDIVRTVKGDPEKVLRVANLLHSNLQFTMEMTPNTSGELALLEL